MKILKNKDAIETMTSGKGTKFKSNVLKKDFSKVEIICIDPKNELEEFKKSGFSIEPINKLEPKEASIFDKTKCDYFIRYNAQTTNGYCVISYTHTVQCSAECPFYTVYD